jgi:hypothetical protein
MTIDQADGMDLAGHEIDPGQEAQRSMPDIFVIAPESRMHARLWRQIRRGGRDRLNARLNMAQAEELAQ